MGLQSLGVVKTVLSKMFLQLRDCQLTKILTSCRKSCLKILLNVKTVVLKCSPKSPECWTIFAVFPLGWCPKCVVSPANAGSVDPVQNEGGRCPK